MAQTFLVFLIVFLVFKKNINETLGEKKTPLKMFFIFIVYWVFGTIFMIVAWPIFAIVTNKLTGIIISISPGYEFVIHILFASITLIIINSALKSICSRIK